MNDTRTIPEDEYQHLLQCKDMCEKLAQFSARLHTGPPPEIDLSGVTAEPDWRNPAGVPKVQLPYGYRFTLKDEPVMNGTLYWRPHLTPGEGEWAKVDRLKPGPPYQNNTYCTKDSLP